MKMAERVARSKQALTDAVLTLLRDEAPGRITITKVCQLANITRPTFYQYYKSVDDLIGDVIAQRLYQHQATAFGLDANAPAAEFDAALQRFLQLIWDDRNLVFMLRHRDVDPVRLRTESVAIISSQIVAHMPNAGPQVALRARFAAAGITELLGAWLATTNPAQLQSTFTSLLVDLVHAVMHDA